MLTTLLEARTSALRNIAGSCPASAEFLQLLNDATRQLMARGDWAGTLQPIYVCARSGCICWPRYVESIRALNWCGHHDQPVPIHGLWWKFLEHEHHYHRMRGHPAQMQAQGQSPVHTDIQGPGRLVRAYADAALDIGKTVTIFGLDDNQQPLVTQNLDGTLSPGVVITIAAPFGSTAVFVSRIDRVLKDETTGLVRLYAYDATNDVLEDLAVYEPSETNPDYVRYFLTEHRHHHGAGHSGGGCSHSRGVVALVKLKFIPAKLDTDLVLIQNLDALKLMMQAIKFREANDPATARQYEADAIRELNLELANKQPDRQMPVRVEPFNGIRFGNHCF